jgi:uncharacterized protein (DUF1778 family)
MKATETVAKKERGRPRLKEAKVNTCITAQVTVEELEIIDRAAALTRRSKSNYVAGAALEQAKRDLGLTK